MNFMIKFKVLAIKTKINNIHIIFFLKKNIRNNIIKTILKYLPIVVPELLKEWKIAIISIRQEYESIKVLELKIIDSNDF